jgi:sortase A
MFWLRNIERLLLVFGLLMLAFYLAARLHQTVLVNAALQQFGHQQPAETEESRGPAQAGVTPDVSLWSEQRIKGYRESLATHFAPAIGILRISKIHVQVPVLEGTDELTLNRGVGHLAGTSNLGGSGNSAIAGHRDGFFRGLKDVSVGDRIELDTPAKTVTYVVDRIIVVDPTDVSVLKPRPRPSLTLITCYPFYFVGSAPKRYIVQASVADSASAKVHAGVQLQPK